MQFFLYAGFTQGPLNGLKPFKQGLFFCGDGSALTTVLRTMASGRAKGIIMRQRAPHPFWQEMVAPD
jgi:hypothetical protein